MSVENGKPQYSKDAGADESEGVGGWISRMVRRTRGNGKNGEGQGGNYRPLGQGEEGE
ncbi:MAG: hypothetical protein M1824_002579 [Vezdaea acicularis]|nr:MAG: hypothetical protein M1824_002579 [Vezdaea acicularis]